MACSRNVDLSVCMLQIWYIGFSHFLLPIDVTVVENLIPCESFLSSRVVCTHELV